MKADYSRLRFNLNKGYTRVLQQQGRVILDADWNEQVCIQADLDRKRLRDVVGYSGVPYGDAGFLVGIDDAGAAFNLNLEAGTIYVAGHRIHLDAAGKYSPQPFLPDPPAISDPGTGTRVDLVYLRVRERHLTYLEDDGIREIALGGPDTTTRVQNIWQVLVKEDVSLGGCGDDADVVMVEAGVGAGALTTIEDSTTSMDDNPCVTPAEGGYRGLENRLYRVEVHAGGTIAGGASVKWSRHNGAVAFNVLEINVSSRVLTLARLGWDRIVTLAPSSWIELISAEDELSGRPGAMLQIAAGAGAVNDAQRQVTLKEVTNIGDILNGYAAVSDVKVRLWESDAIVLNDDFDATANATEILLGDGIGIEIGVDHTDDMFRTGDYWTFAARTIAGRVEELIESPPQGQKWHCCRLALIHWNPGDGESVVMEDCRPLFPALTEMLQLHYVGGDGQEGKPGDTLPGELVVRVSRGEHPVEDVPITFDLKTEGLGGKVFTSDDPGGNTVDVFTGSDGLARCKWQLGSNRGRYHQQVLAWIGVPAGTRLHQQVTFNANLSLAEAVSYQPPDGCINIGARARTVADALNSLCVIEASGVTYTPPRECPNLEGTTTVAEALDALCDITGTPADDPAFHVTAVEWLRDGDAVHDQDVPLDLFIGGLSIACDGEPDNNSIKQASVFITLELPSKILPGTLMAYILEGDVRAEGEKILWQPTAEARQFLEKDIGRVIGTHGRVLARLFLKGSKIWLRKDPRIHLDGDAVTHPEKPHGLSLPSGDGEAGGTFEMWFNLDVKVEGIHVVGVLHPKGLMGLGTISIKDKTVIVEDPSAVNLRLDALDLGYAHREAMNAAGFPDHPVSGTLFNAAQARRAMVEGGFENTFEAVVLLQEKYQGLQDPLGGMWNETFSQLKLSFSFIVVPADRISDTIRKGIGGDKVPSLVICDDTVFGVVRSQFETVEPYGLIRRSYFRRV